MSQLLAPFNFEVKLKTYVKYKLLKCNFYLKYLKRPQGHTQSIKKVEVH